jgi:SIR2-like domain
LKERYCTNLVTSLRYRQCVLLLGPEIPAKPASSTDPFSAAQDLSYTEALTRRLASELEDDNRRVTGSTLAGVAQQYEDAQGFGRKTMRALAAQFYTSAARSPSDVHRSVALLPFTLIMTTCHDDLMTRALQESGKRPLAQVSLAYGDKHDNPEFTPSQTPDEPVVYHLFGSAQEPSSLVLSENDVLDFLIAVVSERPPLPTA